MTLAVDPGFQIIQIQQHMHVELQLFAIAKIWAGTDRLTLELPEMATVGDLRTAFVARCPQVDLKLPLRFAVNSEYVDDQYRLSPTDEIACIPPVSGG